MVFFFQAEDGIRDYKVTGVQTCALPISAYVLVDAFDVPAATISRLQQTDTAVTFTGGGWMQGITTDRWSGGGGAGPLHPGGQNTVPLPPPPGPRAGGGGPGKREAPPFPGRGVRCAADGQPASDGPP